MKVSSFAIVLFAALPISGLAQIVIRNDFVLNSSRYRLKNKGITRVTINLDNRPNLNQLINGRGGRTLVINVETLRKRSQTALTYRELAERLYVPGSASLMPQEIPMHALSGGPFEKKKPVMWPSPAWMSTELLPRTRIVRASIQ